MRRKFQIDDQLGRLTKALHHLKELEEHDEVQEYIEKHDLYPAALSMYQYDPARYKQTMRLYANFLSVQNKHKEAAIAFEFLSDHAAAWPCYRSANMWREALSSATLSGLASSELSDLASSLAEGLVESKDYFDAATITLDYLSDLDNAARLLCKGSYFAEALRIVTLRGQPALIEEAITPGLVERSAEMTEFLADMRSQIVAQVPRLRDLRAKKAEDPIAFYDGMEDANIPDNVSLAPTNTTSGNTFMTKYTNRTGTVNTQATRQTSKNKRREERKRARGKKGTVYEEEYLVNSIERLIERINSMQNEIQRLVQGLVRMGMRERAVAVESAVEDVIERCKEAVREIYPPTETPAATSNGQAVNGGGIVGEMIKPQGGDATLWDSLNEVEKKREPPIVKAFAKLSLLG